MTHLPLDWPPLRAEAERLAREHHVAWARHAAVPSEGWNADLEPWVVGAFRDLLADLSRPASRDHWCRWLAERVGLDATHGVLWYRTDSYGTYRLVVGVPSELAQQRETRSWDFDTDGVTDPAEALRLALLAVGA